MSIARKHIRSVAFPTKKPLARPAAVGGAVAWARAHLFSSWGSTIATALGVAILVLLIPDLLRYCVIDAVWSAPDGAACRAPGVGACWAFVGHKIDYFRYGAYPQDQRWRVDATLLFGATLLARIMLRAPIAGWRVGWLLAAPLIAAFIMPGVSGIVAHPWPEGALVAFALGFAGLLAVARVRVGVAAMLFFLVFPIVGFFLLRGAPALGLPLVDTSLWGGLLVTLIVSTVGIVLSIPGGVLLALGRRSKLPAVRICSAAFIEIVRGVPLVTVLFMANTMLPLFVPPQWTPDRLVRPLVGVSVFAAAYMAEVVRGGLQAIPKGQYEAAGALGFGFWGMMRFIVLPQALTLTIPGIVNSCIALFKDTTLVAAVGIYDFLNVIDTARIDPQWASPSVSTTGYAFAALVYWVFCFGMSRYSQAMERRLGAGRRR